MRETLPELSGIHLSLDEYLEDFRHRFWSSEVRVRWKFERRQVFAEPENDSWRAFRNGNWSLALEILRERTDAVVEYENRLREHGFEVRRVRVAEDPITPYLTWELNSLKRRYDCGGKIRVASTDQIADFEADGELPEVFIVASDTAYRVLYDNEGKAVGAIRATGKAVVDRWVRFLERIYDTAEELGTFFDRKIKGRPPLNAA